MNLISIKCLRYLIFNVKSMACPHTNGDSLSVKLTTVINDQILLCKFWSKYIDWSQRRNLCLSVSDVKV